MKKIVLGFLFFIPAFLSAQTFDSRIDSLIEQDDWFGLEREYRQSKAKLSPHYRLLVEGLLGLRFNRIQQAYDAFAAILENHQEKLSGHLIGILFFFHQILFEAGTDCHYTADSWKSVIDQLPPDTPEELLKQFRSYHRLMDSYRNVPSQEWARKPEECSVRFDYIPVGRGEIIRIPVQVNGKKADFVFDTGCSSNLISEEYAEELGIRILNDSILINGIHGRYYGKSAVADSIEVGGITCRNARFGILPKAESSALDSARLRGFIGFSFVRPLPEIQLFPQERILLFPAKESPVPPSAKPNLLYNDILYTQLDFDRHPVLFLFDTGNASADLTQRFYRRFPTWSDRNGTTGTIRLGSLGGIKNKKVLNIHELPLQIGNQTLILKNIPIILDQEETTEEGNLGVSFLRLCNKITLNLKQMYMQIEPQTDDL